MNKDHNFHDINKFPKEFGIVVFPISISRAENQNGQDPKQCLEYLYYFSPSKVSAPKVGLNMIYGDFLYLNSSAPAAQLKEKSMRIVLSHKNAFSKLIAKDHQRFQIQHAFSYQVWNQMYLNYHGDFASELKKLKKIYEQDVLYQKYASDDANYAGRKLDNNQINFFLEEYLLFYALAKGVVSIPNEYVMGREKWILTCYPGKPLKTQVYLHQLNPLNLEAPDNPYQDHFYDLEEKILTDMSQVNLDTYNYEYSS